MASSLHAHFFRDLSRNGIIPDLLITVDPVSYNKTLGVADVWVDINSAPGSTDFVGTHGGAITADHSYTWCGNVRCLAHRGGPTNLDKNRGRDKWNSAGYAAAASG
jgi:hypothetical protein